MPHRALEFNDATYDSIVLPFKKISLFFPTRSVQQWIIVKSLRLRAASSLNGNKRLKKWKWKENHVRKCRFFTLPCWHFTTMAAVEKAQNLFGSTLLELLRSKSVWGRAISRKFSWSLDMPTCADLRFFFLNSNFNRWFFATCFTTCFDVVSKIHVGRLISEDTLGLVRVGKRSIRNLQRWEFFEATHGKN